MAGGLFGTGSTGGGLGGGGSGGGSFADASTITIGGALGPFTKSKSISLSGGGSTAGAATIPTSQGLVPNQASYYGLNIPVSAGKRAILGVPIFAGAVKVSGDARLVDLAFAFGEPLAPQGAIIDTQLTKIWINGELVEERNISFGWNTSGSLNYVLYPGYADQLPDPDVEKWLGSGDAPGFRGMIYLMFKDFPLHTFSNDFTIPFVRVELVDIVDNSIQVKEFTLTDAAQLSDQVIIPNWDKMHGYFFVEAGDNEHYVVVVDLTTNIEITRNRITFTDGTEPTTLQITSGTFGSGILEPDTNFILTTGEPSNQMPVYVFDPYSGIILSKFGGTGSGFFDDENLTQAVRHWAFISQSSTMTDRIVCKAGIVSGEIGCYRLSANGQLTLAFSDDVLEIMGDSALGDVTHMITGDKIGVQSNANRGYGTVLVARETAIYRITIQEGQTGNGEPLDVEANGIPLHLPPFSHDYEIGGTGGRSNNYVDIVETFDVTNGVVAATAQSLVDGTSVFTWNFSDAGDLSASALDDRVVAYVKLNSIRTLQAFHFNTRSIDGNVPGGVVEFDIVVSDDGMAWTLASDFDLSNSGLGFMIGSNAPLYHLVYINSFYTMSAENSTGTPFIPAPAGQYVGIALRPKNYTAGAVTGLQLGVRGRDGLRVVDEVIQYPDLVTPHMIKLWNAPAAYTIQMMFLEPRSEDIIVFYTEDANPTTVQYVTRMRMNEDILGLPVPTDPNGLGVAEQWTQQLIEPINVWANMHKAWDNSDLGGNSLGYAQDEGDTFTLINISTGHQRNFDFTAWRFFGSGSDEAGDINIEQRQVWYGSGNYLLGIAESPTPDFNLAKLLPFKTDVTAYNLSDFIAWMSLRVGYTSDDIDVVDVTDQVVGTILLERIAFRSLMDNIGAVFDFDVFESEGKIKFAKVPKGGNFTIDNTLTIEDLSAIEGGEGIEPNDPVAVVGRDPALDLPGAVDVKYIDLTSDYTVNVAHAQRTRFPVSTVSSNNVAPTTYAVPIIMTPSEALLRASRLLYTAWNSKSKLEFRLPTAYLTIEPADIISLPVNGTTYVVKALDITMNADHSMTVISESISAEQIDELTALPPLQLPQGVAGPSASILYYLDIPPLRGADVVTNEGEGLSIYTAVVSKGQGTWNSGKLYFKHDTPSYLLAYQNGIESDGAGIALGILPKGNESSMDIDNSLNVLLTNDDGNFATITYQQLLDGGNLMAYGAPRRWEIIQVQTVVNIAGSVYTLSNFVRGLYGTEFFSGFHLPSDKLILLDRPPVNLHAFAPYDEVGAPILMKAVGARQEEADIGPKEYIMSGAFERMLPPTNPAARYNANSDIIITWDRRTRLDNVWVDEFEEVPLEDTAAGFELEIYNDNGGTPVRTITGLTGTAYAYLTADVVADFVDLPNVIYLRVYHMSTEVGRSFPLERQIDVAAL